jgi:protein-S-isoprenylcysteine O-methyltransferase Ste14
MTRTAVEAVNSFWTNGTNPHEKSRCKSRLMRGSLSSRCLVILRYGVIAREETYLERRFGDAYRD